jgi:hypothetical protein
MKKIIISIVAACYFVVTCGVVVNYHYCMKKLASTSFFKAVEKECGVCGMEMHNASGCCHDEVQIVKMSDDQNKVLIASYDIPSLEPAIIEPSEFLVARFENSEPQRHFHNHSPPLLSAQDTYLKNNVFRI